MTILLQEVRDGVATLTLNRPAVNNAYDRAMIAGLFGAVGRLEADPAVRRALADEKQWDVDLDGGAVGVVLPDDVDPVGPPGRWAALLPALDPTTMGWKQRDFYLGPHAALLFDRNGNGGPTAWVDGRIVGGWTQKDDGQVVVVACAEVDRAGQRLLDDQADRLTSWLSGDVVRSIYQSPLVRSGSSSST